MKIIYTRPDGGLSVVHPATKEDLERVLGPLTDGAYRSHVYERSIPADATNITEVTANDLPADRTYRNAWKHEGGKIIHDMAKARALHRDKLRVERAPELAKLDIDYQRADEAVDAKKKGEIAAKKQVLRDVTNDPAIEAATTIEELKAIRLP